MVLSHGGEHWVIVDSHQTNVLTKSGSIHYLHCGGHMTKYFSGFGRETHGQVFLCFSVLDSKDLRWVLQLRDLIEIVSRSWYYNLGLVDPEAQVSWSKFLQMNSGLSREGRYLGSLLVWGKFLEFTMKLFTGLYNLIFLRKNLLEQIIKSGWCRRPCWCWFWSWNSGTTWGLSSRELINESAICVYVCVCLC